MSIAGRVVVFLVVAASVSARADEHVLFEVQGNDTLLGTIRPSDEQEAILCNLVAGTTLKAAVKSTQKTGPVPTLQLLLDAVPVAAAQISVKGRGAALAPLKVPASGTYKLVVAGDGVKDGDYQLTLNWTAQKTFAGTGTSAGDTTFPFSAPANSVVSIALSPASGSSFVPHLLALDGPGNAAIALSGGSKASRVHLPARGDWTLHFQSDAAEGAWKAVVKVAPPKVAKHKADIRDGALAGAFSDGSNVVGAVVDPGSGGSLTVDGTGSPIDGSSVTIPPGSLGKSTSIFVAQAAPYTPPGSDHPAGPAVEFGPSGTKFDAANPAVVTIPFDAGAFPGGTSTLVVYVKDSKGDIEPVLPTSSYVFGPNTVTFSTSHFSTFQAATTSERGTPTGDYELLQVTGTPTGNLGGEVSVYTGGVFLQNGMISGNTDGVVLTFSSGVAAGASATTGTRGLTLEGGMMQQNDSLTAVDAMSGPFRLRRGLTDDILVMEHDAGLQLGVGVLLRRIPGRPTLNALAGQWHAFLYEFKAGPSGGGNISLAASAGGGTATISADGTFQVHLADNVKRTAVYPGGEWSVDPPTGEFANGTLTLDPDFQIVLTFASQSQTILKPVLGGDVLFGSLIDADTGFGPSTGEVGLLVLVRNSSGVSAAGLLGNYVDVSGGLTLHAPDGNPAPDQLGLQWQAQTGGDILGPGNTFAHDSVLCLSGYDASGGVPVQSSSRVFSAAGTRFKVTSDGTFSVVGAKIDGAVLASRGAVFYLQRDATTLAPGFILRLPPTGP